MNIRFFSQILFVFSITFSAFEIQSQAIDSQSSLLVHKTSTCGCCKKWIKHLKSNGFSTSTKDHQSLEAIKEKFDIKPEYRSCHTAVSEDGYIFEGHIPSKYIYPIFRHFILVDISNLNIIPKNIVKTDFKRTYSCFLFFSF